MSLDKAIMSGKEHRKPYQGSARFDGSCRHGGDCPWCIGNRTVKNKRAQASLRDDLREANEEDE